MRIVMLLTDGYGCLGGIAQYNRDFLDALNASPRVESVLAWPRRIVAGIEESIPEAVIYERRRARGKWPYAFGAVAAMLTPRPCELVICAHLHLLPLAWLTAKRRGAALALMIYGVESWQPTRNALTNFLVQKIDHLISISRFSDEKFRIWAQTEVAATLIPPSVDLDRFTPGERPAELVARYGLDGRRVLMTMGRLAASERYKGVDELIALLPNLAEQFPDIAYLVVGDGDDRARLESKAAEFRVTDRVVFAGQIAESEKADHYRLADIFLLPSRGEGFGIVLIEAAACGVEAIGSAVDGGREALLDGALGRLVDPADDAQLHAALVAVLPTPAPHMRSPAVETFSRQAFERRVANWLESVAYS